MIRLLAPLIGSFALIGCTPISDIGKPPKFTDLTGGPQQYAMYSTRFPESANPSGQIYDASLWTSTRASLFGDRRAAKRGDILTVVIEIDDEAEISNASDRQRSANSNLSLPHMVGLPQSLDKRLPDGASMANAVNLQSQSQFSGDGSVQRREKLALRVAATIVEELPNGILRLEGQQEVRVNHELRELIVSGYIRSGDISRLNEITYDKIAGARISYGGRGQISDVQQPRWGQRLIDKVLPF